MIHALRVVAVECNTTQILASAKFVQYAVEADIGTNHGTHRKHRKNFDLIGYGINLNIKNLQKKHGVNQSGNN
jgi:hypothetical protein